MPTEFETQHFLSNFGTMHLMFAALTLRRLDDQQLDAWIRDQTPESRKQRRGLREFRRRQEACHREHDMVTVRVGLVVGVLLLGAAFGAVLAAG